MSITGSNPVDDEMQPRQITQEERDRLQAELERISTELQNIARERREAGFHIDDGGVPETAQADLSRNEQMLRDQEEYIKSILRGTVVSAVESPQGVVVLGSKVRLRYITPPPLFDDEDEIEDDEFEVTLATVPSVMNSFISTQSPMGAAIFGKCVGDKVEYTANGVILAVEILSIT